MWQRFHLGGQQFVCLFVCLFVYRMHVLYVLVYCFIRLIIMKLHPLCWLVTRLKSQLSTGAPHRLTRSEMQCMFVVCYLATSSMSRSYYPVRGMQLLYTCTTLACMDTVTVTYMRPACFCHMLGCDVFRQQ